MKSRWDCRLWHTLWPENKRFNYWNRQNQGTRRSSDLILGVSIRQLCEILCSNDGTYEAYCLLVWDTVYFDSWMPNFGGICCPYPQGKRTRRNVVLIDQSTGRHTAEDIPRKLTCGSWKRCCSVSSLTVAGVSFHQPTAPIPSIFLLVLGIIIKLEIAKIKTIWWLTWNIIVNQDSYLK